MISEINVSESVKMCYFQQKYEKFSGEAAPFPIGPTPHHPQHLLYLDPSHSKILARPLLSCTIINMGFDNDGHKP